jgi:hypothetical protein
MASFSSRARVSSSIFRSSSRRAAARFASSAYRLRSAASRFWFSTCYLIIAFCN